MKKLLNLIIPLPLVIFASGICQGQELTTSELKAKLERRERQLSSMSTPSVRGAAAEFAAQSLLAEEAIRQEATDLGVTVTVEEVNGVLVQVLGKSGVVDLLTPPAELANDPNVRLYLESQDFLFEDLYSMGESICLWTKLVTAGVKISEEEVSDYLRQNPSAAVVPERVQLKITFFESASSKTGTTRGSAWASISPMIPISVRGETEPSVEAPADWIGLNLYLAVDNLEPSLRQAISGLAAGDNFGPVTLNSGAVIAGSIAKVLPTTDISGTPYCQQNLLVQTALSKVNDGEERLSALVDQYFEKVPGQRGFWDALKTFGGYAWKALPYVGAAAGTVVGAYYGGWGGALAGAKTGWNIANDTKNWFSNWSNGSPSYNISPNYQMPMPRYSPMPYQGGYGQYRVSPMPANYWGYNNYHNYPYNPYGGGGYAQPYSRPYMPPIYQPMPLYY